MEANPEKRRRKIEKKGVAKMLICCSRRPQTTQLQEYLYIVLFHVRGRIVRDARIFCISLFNLFIISTLISPCILSFLCHGVSTTGARFREKKITYMIQTSFFARKSMPLVLIIVALPWSEWAKWFDDSLAISVVMLPLLDIRRAASAFPAGLHIIR